MMVSIQIFENVNALEIATNLSGIKAVHGMRSTVNEFFKFHNEGEYVYLLESFCF